MPLLIGRLAGLSSTAKNDLTPLATMAGLLILFTLYLVFIDKPKDKQPQHPAPSSAQPSNCNATCIHDDYSIYKGERRKQRRSGREAQSCDPTVKYR
ncbi:MAG: hypothetical protein D3917_01590 [Candidatus Electrothrix sp. AX5]|nr:hypothetical protein [Candidatus Electrothrix sp. AX5]